MDGNQLLRRKKLYLFDMDGTLYCGSRLFPFTRELLQTLRDWGLTYLYMTNNSASSVEDYMEKLKGMGIEARREEFITSSQATVHCLKQKYRDRRFYVCGTESVRREFRDSGIRVTEDPEEARGVVVCLDFELTYEKIRKVCRILSTHPEVPYLATHPDKVCPWEFGLIPDCGSICDLIAAGTGRQPDIIVGKPGALMPELAMARAGCSPAETVVVGDRIDTDVRCGIAAGTATVLVLSGETTLDMYQKSPEKPDLLLQDAGEILKALR